MCSNCARQALNRMYTEVIHTESVRRKSVPRRQVSIVPTTDPYNSLHELNSWVQRFMKRFGIGKYLSVSKWGTQRRAQIRKQLADTIKKRSEDRRTGLSPFAIYDDLQQVKGADQYTPGEIAVAARTESSRMRVVFQLLQWKEAGAKYVTYRTKGDAKVRDGHSKYNGRIFEIDWLLRPENDQWRIPLQSDTVGGPFNCRCTYMLYLGEPRGRVNDVS